MFNVRNNAARDSDFNWICILFAEDFKFSHNIGHVDDCKLLHFHFDGVKCGSGKIVIE